MANLALLDEDGALYFAFGAATLTIRDAQSPKKPPHNHGRMMGKISRTREVPIISMGQDAAQRLRHAPCMSEGPMNQPAISRRGLIATLAAAGTLPLAACGGTETRRGRGQPQRASAPSTAEGAFKIGILQLTQHAALDQTNEGFIAALDEAGIDYEPDQQNASNDQTACQTIAQTFVNGGCDLIFAIGTPAAQAVAAATQDIPVVGSAITDFESVGLVESNDAPGGNVTGSSDMTPVADQIALLQELVPDAQNVGILYCTAEENSRIQAELAVETCNEAWSSRRTSRPYRARTRSRASWRDDGRPGRRHLCTHRQHHRRRHGTGFLPSPTRRAIPTIVGCDTMVEDGGTASYSINYFDLGHKAGEMALQILTEGASPADMPIEYLDASECTLIANQASADACGVDLSILDDPELV